MRKQEPAKRVMPGWLSVDEAAEYLRVSRRTIYKFTQDGRLPAYVLGPKRTRRFRRVDLDKVPTLLNPRRPAGFNSLSDPDLAELWDNEEDAVYDQL